MARLVVSAVVGVAVGYFFGPQAGLQAFTLTYGVTGFLDPTKHVLGPKLNDLKAPAATYGSPIAYIEGAPRLAGNYIWCSDKRPIATTESQGKGGPGVDSTTFTYEMDVLIELAINRCAAVRRGWSNGKLIWSNADDADAETIAASHATTAWRDLRFYDGADDQLPDPTYEAAVGVGNAPAYRGRTTLMIEGLNLGASGQVPILTWEVLSEAEDVRAVSLFTQIPTARYYTGGIPAMNLGGFDMLQVEGDTLTDTVCIYAVDGAGVATLSLSLPAPNNTGGGVTTFGGNSDVSCIVLSNDYAPIPNVHVVMLADASYQEYNCGPMAHPEDAHPSNAGLFSRRADAIVFGSADFSYHNKFARFALANPNAIATSPSLATTCCAMTICGSYVYCLSTDQGTVYQLDLSTMALLDTFASPITPGGSSGDLVADERDQLYATHAITNGGEAWTLSGTTWTPYAHDLGDSVLGQLSNSGARSVVGGVIFGQHWSGLPSDFLKVSYAATKVAIVTPSLDQVVRRLCLRTGLLTDDDIDVSDLSHDVAIADGKVFAMAVSQVSTTRATIETLMGAYLFESSEGAKIRFVRRGGASAFTIPYANLSASTDGTDEPLPIKRANDIEIAARVSVKYANVANDFQDGLEAADRLVTASMAEQVIEIPLGFLPGDAKKLADSNTLDLAVSLLQIGPVAIPSRYYAEVEPSDVIILTAQDGSTYRARVMKTTLAPGILTLELVLDDATVISSAAETDDSYASSTLIRVVSDTDLAVLDAPIFRDADDNLGPYVAVDAPDPWAAAEVDKSSDDAAFAKVVTISDRTVIGVAASTLPDFAGGWTFDDASELFVNCGEDVLSSYTKDDAVNGLATPYMVGAEVIIPCAVALQSSGPNVYRMSSMLRGVRGTEWAIPGHTATERVVAIQVSGMRKVKDETADLNATRYYKAITLGKSGAALTAQSFVDTGVALKPFAPVDLEVANVSGDLLVTWIRRTRLQTAFEGFLVPLGEATEAYQVDVVDSGSGVVLRSMTVTSPAMNYDVGMQTADGVSSGSAIHFKVAQLSAIVGPGYPAIADATGTLTPQAEIATITLGGAFASGLPMFVQLAGTTVSYTSTGGDATLAGIATSLASAIDALAAYTATAVGAVITVTGAPSTPFSISAGLVGAAPLSNAAFQSAEVANPGSSKAFALNLSFTGTVPVGKTFRLRFENSAPGYGNRYIEQTMTTTPGQSPISILGVLAAKPQVQSGLIGPGVTWFGTTAETPLGETQWSLTTTTDFGAASFTSSIIAPGHEVIPVDRPQAVELELAAFAGSPTAGQVYRITLAGTNFDYTVVGGDTYTTVIAALAALITGATYTASDGSSSPYEIIRIIANTPAVPFTFSGQLIPGSVTLTTAITQPAI